MANWRPVDVRVWNDRKFLAGSDDARLLWLFLLTCPSLPIPGVVVGGDAALAEQLGWTPERLRERFQELSRNGLRVRRESRIVWLPNALKYQPPANPNMVKGWAKKWDDVPEGSLKPELWEALKIACKSWSILFAKLFAKPSVDGSPNGFANGSGNGFTHEHQHEHQHEHEHYQDPPIPPKGGVARRSKSKPDVSPAEFAAVMRVLGKLSELRGGDVAYEGAKSHVRLIAHQLRKGRTEAELYAVIAHCCDPKSEGGEGWKGNPEMHSRLRPETLFGPENIEKYLPEARVRYRSHIARKNAELAAAAPQPSLAILDGGKP